MNVAQERPRSWTPHIILFSVVLHAVLIYYIASAFNFVPPVELPTLSEPTPVFKFNPKLPDLQPEKVEREPRFRPRPTLAPVQPQVDPIPMTPQIAKESTSGADVISVDEPIPEQPVSQALPSYPRTALERGVEGRVVMSITIMPDGSVRDIVVLNARPQGYFEAAAVRSVQTWRYRPSNMVRRNVIVHMDFELKDA